MKRRTLIGSAGVAATSLLAGCLAGLTGGSDVPEQEVTAENDSFNPITASIEAGTRIKWVNNDSYVHTVTAEQFHENATGWSFDETVGQDESIEYRFEDPGIYQYRDKFVGEENMCGAILVGDVSFNSSLPCE